MRKVTARERMRCMGEKETALTNASFVCLLSMWESTSNREGDRLICSLSCVPKSSLHFVLSTITVYEIFRDN